MEIFTLLQARIFVLPEELSYAETLIYAYRLQMELKNEII